MRTLFSKIFACFLLSHLLASLLTYGLLTATNPRAFEPPHSESSRSDSTRAQNRPRREQRMESRRRRARNFEILRWVGIFIAANGVAYGLARYLTAPTARLRRATQQLASGDLTARVGAQMGARRDELADLGGDFDVMAQRIQSLVVAERRLLGDISHELRSPLARMQVALDLANQTADEETRGFLARIEREGARLNELIGQLLALTRLETTGASAPREPVNLAELLAEVVGDADFEARSENRKVRVTSSQECFVSGNAQLLRSAMENVIRNATRYTREGTEIEVALQREEKATTSRRSTPASRQGGAWAVINVRDYGPGVPEASLSKLFDPFYRVADARDRQSGGVGLGLSIAERAVRFHGGTIAATNAPGGGLLMEIRLPLVEENAAAS